VTNKANVPHAVLIRSLQPVKGIPTMLERRGLNNGSGSNEMMGGKISGGPGTLSQSMGIRVKDSGTSLQADRIWVEDRGLDIDPGHISAAPRIGVDFAGEDAHLPYRFTLSPEKIDL